MIIQHPKPPMLSVRGRKIEVGTVCRIQDQWAWLRRVRKDLKRGAPCHFFYRDHSWVVGVELFQQVRRWAGWIVYADEHGNNWHIQTIEVERLAERIPILGEAHLSIAARHWRLFTPTDSEQMCLFGAKS